MGIKVWWDQTQIDVGQRIRNKINEGIKNSKSFLILLSSHSLNSQWVLNELDAAMIREIAEKRTIVLPILLGDITMDLLPEDIRGKRYLDLRGQFKRKYKKSRDLLFAAITFSKSESFEGFECIQMNSDIIGRLRDYDPRSYQVGGIPFALVIDTIYSDFIKAYREYHKACKIPIGEFRRFLRQYGHHSAKQLVTFLIVHSKEPAFPVTRKAFKYLLRSFHIFFMGMEIHEKLEPLGFGVQLGIKPNELAYRLHQLPEPAQPQTPKPSVGYSRQPSRPRAGTDQGGRRAPRMRSPAR